jgi:hypothetical protein
MRKTNPLTKLRFKPQVSAAFASVSILIGADCIDLERLRLADIIKFTTLDVEKVI